MAWTAPKTDWAPTDGIADTDLNRIEGDVEYLGEHVDALENTFELSASHIGSSGISIGAGLDKGLILVKRTLADGKKLILKRASFFLSAVTQFRAHIDANTSFSFLSGYTSAADEGDVEPDTTLYSNSTGSPISIYVSILVTNTDGGSAHTLGSGSGIYARFEIQDV